MSGCVVYIDDEPMICRVVTLGLRKRGIDVITFTDPCKAIEYIQNTDVAVVFSDYRMPQMTGSELLQTIETTAGFYIVTGGTGAFDDPVLKAHNCRILLKPLDFDEMAALVEEAGS